MYIIVGLGNPGVGYTHTRHNAGRMVIELLSQGARFKRHKTGNLCVALEDILLVAPDTYMNLSGPPVASLMKFYPISKLLVVHDDIDLPLGKLRFKRGGGTAGHKGIKSISDCIGPDYARLRIGIGRPENPHRSVEDFVLSKFSPDEQGIVSRTIQFAAKAILSIRKTDLDGVERFINTHRF